MCVYVQIALAHCRARTNTLVFFCCCFVLCKLKHSCYQFDIHIMCSSSMCPLSIGTLASSICRLYQEPPLL